ncbi:MAG TPA: adenylate kinase [Bacteroidota bacterium]|nr:adenylate kinase [Bacteroidota bacterium]
MRLLLFGPPGVGKGTQAQLLSKEFSVPHVSTGDVLRAAVADGSELGKRAKAVMDSGNLVTDEIMIGIVREVLASPKTAQGFILDGFPRTLAQAIALSHIFEELDIRDFKVIDLKADDEEIVQRLSNRLVCPKDGRIYNKLTDGLAAGDPCPVCQTPLVQRNDDKEQTVRERLRVYHSTTEPIIHYYANSGVVLSVEATGSVDVVNREIKLMLRESGPD